MLCKEQGITICGICAVYEIFIVQKVRERERRVWVGIDVDARQFIVVGRSDMGVFVTLIALSFMGFSESFAYCGGCFSN